MTIEGKWSRNEQRKSTRSGAGSLGGVLVEVRGLGRDEVKHEHTEITMKICIPSSVEMLGQECFNGCESLSTVTFESGSQLSSIAESAFRYCFSLSSICCPSYLQTILARYQALLKLPAAGLPEGDRVVCGADSVEDETVNRGQNE
jgi:hypothetical protein